MISNIFQKLLFLKAKPELDFKYFSNSRALFLPKKLQYQTSLTGKFFDVVFTFPQLCSSVLLFKLSVKPV